MELTVGYVAGMVAAGFFLAHLLSPNALALIISWRLRDENTAATLTVAGTSFQKSHWPLLLWTDSNQSHGVSKGVLWSARLIPTLGLLLALGSVMTPLGLYSSLSPGDDVQADFVYVADPSPFGYGTPPRSNFSWARQCNGPFMFSGPRPCPFSDSISIVTHFPNGTINYNYPYGLSSHVPDRIVETFSSGTENSSTVSNYFDIQWRRYTTTRSRLYDNESHYLVADNRNMESLTLSNSLRAVEGLVVDSVKGGIGFRNHTLPSGFAYGARWEEDLLFVEPETVCVDTNLTLDFTIIRSSNITSDLVDFHLTDRGGFINLNHTYPRLDLSDPQANPDLYTRAYKAAWLHNAFTALYFNVTTFADEETGLKAWAYVNSDMGKKFPMGSQKIADLTGISALTLTSVFGDYIQGVRDNTTTGLNPFGITSSNYSDIAILCGGAGNGDYANVTNILVACGQMRSVPQRISPGSSLIMEDGSTWMQKIYTCATAAKANVKTVSFSYNTTNAESDGFLTALTVEGTRDKEYLTEESMPLWGVEDTGNAYLTPEINLVWGLVSPDYEGNPNVSTVRQPSLYLPGWFTDDTGGAYSYGTWENMPGSDFSIGALVTAYSVSYSSLFSSTGTTGGTDYTGAASLAMWARWQNLTKSADTASLIPNLVFTDSAASTVVGTKGALGPGNANNGTSDIPVLRVTPIYFQIGYNLPYAIPAFIAALLLILVLSVAVAAALGSGAGYKRMRQQIQQLSSGRIYTTFLYPDSGALSMRSKQWSTVLGDKLVDLSGEYPVPGGMRVPGAAPEEHEFKDTTTVSTVPAWSQHHDSSGLLEERTYDAASPALAQEQVYYGNQADCNQYQMPPSNHEVHSNYHAQQGYNNMDHQVHYYANSPAPR